MRLGPYYVYRHVRSDTNEVFYVGKGTNRRAPSSWFERPAAVCGRNKWWRNIVAKTGPPIVEVVMCFGDEAACLAKERELIALYGRRDLGRGTLVNLTDGGDGTLGAVLPEESRRRLRERFSGPGHPNWGKRLSPETCRRKSLSMRESPHSLRGKKLPEWWRRKISSGKLGARNPFYGKPTPASRRVIDGATGQTHDSVARAAVAIGIRYQSLYDMLTGRRKNRTTLGFA